MKLLITSDNHLGFKETDPIRSEDSFNTFEEIMKIAKSQKVDLILQSGDLFDENRPSRNTYNKTLKILREYCLGGDKVEFTSSIPLNCKNPLMNVSLPILSIHGNHDDPSGFNSVSPLDVMHSSGLINYFGRVENVDEMKIEPILIEKDSKLAIYGIGHIKDRRIQKTFMNGKVAFIRPPGDDYYKILMLHQNRTPREDGYLSEDLIDPFFDLVIYGHEHESIKMNHRNFEVIQCGSTIRTSLCEGESMEKYVYILDSNKKINRIELETVRPLVIENIKVTNENPENQVNRKIESILETVKMEYRNTVLLPLIRLRIDLSGVQNFNRHKIQEIIHDKVANPTDAIRITRKIEKEKEMPISIIKKYEISDIFQGIIDSFEMKALLQSRIVESMNDFVEKDIKESFNNLIKESMESILKNMDFDGLVADSIEDAIKMTVSRLKKEDENSEMSDESMKLSDLKEEDETCQKLVFNSNENKAFDHKANLENENYSNTGNKNPLQSENIQNKKFKSEMSTSYDDLLDFI